MIKLHLFSSSRSSKQQQISSLLLSLFQAIHCIILDGAAIVNMLPPRTATFKDYATDIFLPYITSSLHVARLMGLSKEETTHLQMYLNTSTGSQLASRLYVNVICKNRQLPGHNQYAQILSSFGSSISSVA